MDGYAVPAAHAKAVPCLTFYASKVPLPALFSTLHKQQNLTWLHTLAPSFICQESTHTPVCWCESMHTPLLKLARVNARSYKLA
eukprot:1150961-Pelagomonas_calceolata.AAC.14